MEEELTKDDVTLICEMCVLDKPVTSYCPTCSKYLCESCTDFHSIHRSWCNHKLEKILEQRRDIEFLKMLEKHNQCKVEGHAAGEPDASHKSLETKKGPGSSITVTISDVKVGNENGACGKEETSNAETTDKMEVELPLKANGVDGQNEVKEIGKTDISSITVQSPGISPNGTSLSDSSDNVITVGVGLRNRNKRRVQDCVDPVKDSKFRKGGFF